jgi:hypothetical protein
MKHTHKWQAFGGCDSNPGCFERGNGNMIFASRCDCCGKVKVAGTNYAGQGRDWKRIYESVEAYLKDLWPGYRNVA